MSQAGTIDVVTSNPQIPTTFIADIGTAVPLANNIEILGGIGCDTSASGNTVTIDVTGSGFDWNVVTDATQALVVENGYIGNRGTAITYTLPVMAAVGSVIRITNIGAGLPIIAQNANQYINFTSSVTTVGVGGSLTAIERFDSLELLCIVADTGFNVISSVGNFTIV